MVFNKYSGLHTFKVNWETLQKIIIGSICMLDISDHRRRNECEDGGAKWIYLIIIAKKGLTSRIRVYK